MHGSELMLKCKMLSPAPLINISRLNNDLCKSGISQISPYIANTKDDHSGIV